MALWITYVWFVFCFTVVVGKHHEMKCYDCDDVTDPDDCDHDDQEDCDDVDEVCSTELHKTPFGLIWEYGCKEKTDCWSHIYSVFGKRKKDVDSSSTLICSECCDAFNGCNKALCPLHAYWHLSTTTKPTTTESTTSTTSTTRSSTTTTPKPTTTTTTSSPLTSTSNTKAAFRQTTTRKVTLFPCIDIPSQHLNCALHRANGYCAPVPSLNYELSKLRCRKTCGYC